MSDETYESLLDRSWDEIPEVKALPVGSYRLRGRNASYKAGDGDKNPFFLFVYEVREPMDDVDEDALADLGPDYDVQENRVFHRIWVETGADMDGVRKHLAKHNVPLGGTIKDSLKAFKGTEVIAYLDQRVFENSAGETVTENNAKSFSSTDD